MAIASRGDNQQRNGVASGVAVMVAAALAVASLTVGVGASTAQAAEDSEPAEETASESLTVSEVEFTEGVIDSSYTESAAAGVNEVAEEQSLAVQEAGDDTLRELASEPDSELELVNIARAELSSDNVLVGVTWDQEAVAPVSVHLRYLVGDTWSEWTELEVAGTTALDVAESATQEGTEPFSLTNAASVEVVARDESGATLPGLSVVVVDVEGLSEVSNTLQQNPTADEAAEADEDGQVEDLGEEQSGLNEQESGLTGGDGSDAETSDQIDGSVTGVEEQGSAFEAENAAGSVSLYDQFLPAVVPAALNAAKTVEDTGVLDLKITTRKGWGANESQRSGSVEAITVKGAVVHHFESSNNYTEAQVPGIIRGVYYYHAVTLGWGDIGYNLVVDKFGNVYEGRYGGLTKGVKGAQAYGANSQTFGISMIGSYMKSAPPTVARQAMAKAIAWKLYQHGIKSATGTIQVPGYWNLLYGRSGTISVKTVSAHRDVGATDCPGDAFYAQMDLLRSEVNGYLKTLSASTTSTTTTTEADGFDAGNIISDSVFYNGSAMTEAQIKTFIQEAGKNCKAGSGTTCLKDTKFSTTNLTSLRGGCKALNLSGQQYPWTIIYKTSQACGLNPQVILATLQKEQSGLTQARSAATWAKAMGSGCPDNSGCDASQGGFEKQVYYGADKLVSYKFQSQAGHVDAFKAGRTMTIKQNPSSSCGTQTVKFANVATASLYEYTPYIGNSSVAGCGTLGAKSFYNIMKTYFPASLGTTTGSTTGSGSSSNSGSSSGSASQTAISVAWQTPRQIGSSWNSGAVFPGDWNRDGYADMMLIRSNGDLMYYRGLSGERFASPVRIGTAWQGFTWVQGGSDWDGDGNPDLIARRPNGDLWLYAGNGKGGFKTWYKIGHGWQGMSKMTLSPKGIYAVSASDNRIHFYPANGKGGFLARRSMGTGWGSITSIVAVGDWTGDGNGDLLARDTSGYLYIYPGNSLGQLGSRTRVGSSWNIMTLMGASNSANAKSALWAVRNDGALMSYGIR